MLDFILCVDDAVNTSEMKVEINTSPSSLLNRNDFLKINYSKKNTFHKFENDTISAFILGDLIIPKGKNKERYLESIFNAFTFENIKNIKGNFYIIVLDKINNSVSVINSLFSLLPIYYFKIDEKLIISSSIKEIKKYFPINFTVNQKFLIEKLLFNFAFRNETIYKGINLLPCNHYLKKGQRLKIIKHTNIQDYFTDNPVEVKNSINHLSELFIEKLNDYLPSEYFYITLTGGFDSRTLTAAALNKNLSFSTFSYGTHGTLDLIVPKLISEKMNFQHLIYTLDEKYADDYYLKYLEELIQNTDCNTSISRTHYAYIADEIGKKINYILSGNFGSDLLRTTRQGGVITSDFLLKSLEIDDNDLLRKAMNEYPALNFINRNVIKPELEEIFQDVLAFKEYVSNVTDKNKRYYVYEFEEIYRKYFGPEYIIQNYYGITNRSPFLDFEFVKELLKTKNAGVNSRFKEDNPFFRFKGQVLYAKILQKLKSPLYYFPLDKGYKPSDFFSTTGKLNIAVNYFKKRMKNKKQQDITYFNQLCFTKNLDYFNKINLSFELCNKETIIQDMAKYSGKLNQVFSFLIYINKFH